MAKLELPQSALILRVMVQQAVTHDCQACGSKVGWDPMAPHDGLANTVLTGIPVRTSCWLKPFDDIATGCVWLCAISICATSKAILTWHWLHQCAAVVLVLRHEPDRLQGARLANFLPVLSG